jgi:mono/diheme cytochrome c family protein
MSHRNALVKIMALWLSLWLLSACGGLAGEPRIVATVPALPTREDAGLPITKPDLVQGAQIYAQNCIRCHGEAGQGDGELVLSGQLTSAPPDFTDSAATQAQTLAESFEVITNGRLDKLMPPWRDSLSESQRWAVAAYTFALRYPNAQITQGQAVWEANCAECHGATGAGDGPRASELTVPMSDLSQPQTLISMSDVALSQVIAEGKGEAMPAFADTLSEAERSAAIAYLRTLSLANVGVLDQTAPLPAATPEVEVASAIETRGTISGRVSSGTQGGSVAAGIPVTLHILDIQSNEETLETTTSEDGTFTFADVPIRDDRAYVTTTTYQGRTFVSNTLIGDSAIPALDLPITIYDLTDDRSVIKMTDLFMQVTAAGDSLEVAQIVTFQNTSDKLYSLTEQTGDGRYASVVVPLPVGGQMFDFADSAERYIFAPNLTAVIDTQPVLPNQDHIMHVLYTVPYQEGGLIELPLEYALEGSVRLLLQPQDLSLTSQYLAPLGVQTMGGAAFQGYGATVSLPAGTMLTYSISGSAGGGGAAVSNNLLAYVLIAVGSLSILAAAAFYYLGRRTPAYAGNEQLRDIIIEQMAELDDLNAQGKIDPDAYEAQRKRLKKRLTKLMK